MTYDDAFDKWLESSPYLEEKQLEEVGMTKIFSSHETNAKRGKHEHRCVDLSVVKILGYSKEPSRLM